MIGLIRRNLLNKSEDMMLIMYKTLVRPIIDYCIPVWKPHYKKDIVQLERIQKRFTKMVLGCKSLTYTKRIDKLKLTTLEERHLRADMIQVYKILNDKQNVFPKQLLKLNERLGRNNSKKLYKFRRRLDGCKYGFTSRVVDNCNALPDRVILSEDIMNFKTSFDCYMREVKGHL